MAEEVRRQFEVIREGFARATFGGALQGCDTSAVGGPIQFAALEENGGRNPEEYVVVQARILSMAVTPYRRFDFTRPGVLKAAVPLFEGLTLYANHWADVNNWKGMVERCAWDEKNDPAGINAQIAVDKVVDPKMARGVETKALRSLSVTIWFAYERSHPDLANFYDRLGEVVDGEMVRFIVTKITNAGEVSIVWEGEDPYAKTFGRGEMGSDGKHGSHGSHGAQGLITDGGEEMKVTAAVMAALGLAAGTEVTEAMLEEKVIGLKTLADSLKADAAVGVAHLKETRERAVTLYKAAKGEKSVESFITGVIEKADLETARAFCLEYQDEVDKSVPLACPNCGEKLSRRSSVPEKAGGELGADKRRVADFQGV